MVLSNGERVNLAELGEKVNGQGLVFHALQQLILAVQV